MNQVARILIYCCVIVVTGYTISSDGLLGQEPPPFGRGGGPRMMVAPSGTAAKVVLLEVPAVQDELKLTNEQRDTISQALQTFREGARPNFDPRETFDLSEDERNALFEEMRQTMEQAAEDAAAEITQALNNDQVTRWKQLSRQQARIAAFLEDDVRTALQLSESQTSELTKLLEGEGIGPPPGDQRGEFDERMEEAMAVLSASQKTTWNSLVGEPFEFPQRPAFGGPGGRGIGPPGGFGPRGGPGGMGASEQKLVKEFDADENGWLDRDERSLARESLANQPAGRGFGAGRRGGRGGRMSEPPEAGPQLSPADVDIYPKASLYEPTVLRTFFIEFENDDWESELEAFKPTDVEVPATLTVDGRKYENVGISFRGMSSFGMVPAGYKRSFNISLDLVTQDQRLYGYKNINLLNGSGDPSFMSTVLYSAIARQLIPAPKANFVRVVINGESWGVYTNVQQFDKTFIDENFDGMKGTRWKVSGSPGGDGGLRYTGEDLEPYKARYEMKSSDGDKAWRSLVNLCRVLNETPLEDLEEELSPILDIDGTLKFLALDVALVNHDGYWTRASDYYIFLDDKGTFHLIPHDMNESFNSGGGGPGGPRGRGGDPQGRPPGRPGRGFGAPENGASPTQVSAPNRLATRQDERPRPSNRRGEQQDDRPRGRGGRGGRFGGGGPFGGGGGAQLDPLVGLDNDRMPLRTRLLAVPELRQRYLQYVKEIADKGMNWEQVGPVIQQYRALIDADVKSDTRKLGSYEQFLSATDDSIDNPASLHAFLKQRRDFLLNYQPAADANDRQ